MSKPPGIQGITLRTDATGRTRYRVRVRRDDALHTATFPTLPEALAWRDRTLAAVDAGELPELPQRPTPQPRATGEALTVDDATRRLVRGMVAGTIRDRRGLAYKPSVTRKYERALRLDVLPRIGALPLATLSRGDVQRLVDALAAEKSAEHARQALTALRVALRTAERYEELHGPNPCERVTVPADREKREPIRVLDAAETTRLLDAARADDARLGRSFALPFLSLLLGTGLRHGEALALRYGPDGLDLDAGRVTVRASLDRYRDASGGYAELDPKSATSRRVVPLTAASLAALLAHRDATGTHAGALVFAADDGKPLAPQGVPRATFTRCAVAAGLIPKPPTWRRKRAAKLAASTATPEAAVTPPAGTSEPTLRVHDLRHTYATHALRAGLSAHAVAKLLGHADAGLVWRRYGHALPDELALAGVALDAWRESMTAPTEPSTEAD